MPVNDILAQARALIATENDWCQYAIARKGDSSPQGPLADPQPTKLGVLGPVRNL